MIGIGKKLLSIFNPKWLWDKYVERRDKEKIYNYLKEHTANNATDKFRKTVEIANNVNLEEGRVRKICSIHPEVDQCIQDPDNWGIYGPEKTSIYEERGILTL